MLDNGENDFGDLMKFENSARIFINGDVGEESSWHAELRPVWDTEGVDSDYKGHKNYTQNDYLRELYVDTNSFGWDFRVGKQQVVWGTADGTKLLDTTLGRAIFNTALPESFPYVNATVIKSDIGRIVEAVIERYPRSDVAETLDAIKSLGFQYATKAGLTIALDDVKTPPTIGAAIRRMTSAPVPVAHRIGSRAKKVVITVMALGRIRCTAPSASWLPRAGSSSSNSPDRETAISCPAWRDHCRTCGVSSPTPEMPAASGRSCSSIPKPPVWPVAPGRSPSWSGFPGGPGPP